MPSFFIYVLFFWSCLSVRKQDLVHEPPGMEDAIVYSGYLNTFQNDRKLHYIFVQAQNSPDKAPLTIWLDGGPGCSSLVGYMKYLGPYIVGDSYKVGDKLEKNPFRWTKDSNMLFIESPGMVGFSSDTDPSFIYNDNQTADDCFMAIKDFIWNVAPQFSNRPLYITGQSYSGKYIPDLAVRVLDHNKLQNVKFINLKGIMIGNGVMNHLKDYFYKSRHLFLVEHDFLSERQGEIFYTTCQIDYYSPRCKWFREQSRKQKKKINVYNVYEVCSKQKGGYGSSNKLVTDMWLDQIEKKLDEIHNHKISGKLNQKKINKTISLRDIPKCQSQQGMIDYMNLNKVAYHVDWVHKQWDTCNQINYDILDEASMAEYKQIFQDKSLKVWLYSGDWDDQVPLIDTIYHIEHFDELNRKKVGNRQPWFLNGTHAGFYQLYDYLSLIIFKGAGHQVPLTKAQPAYQMFYNFINDRPIETPVPIEQNQ